MSPPRPIPEPSSSFPGYVVVCSHSMTVPGQFMARVEIRRERDGKRICPFDGWSAPGPYASRHEADERALQAATFLVNADIANPEP